VATDDFFLVENSAVTFTFILLVLLIFSVSLFVVDLYWKCHPPKAADPRPSSDPSVYIDLPSANETIFNVTPRHGSPLVPRRDPDIEAMLVSHSTPPPRYSSLSLPLSPSSLELPEPPNYRDNPKYLDKPEKVCSPNLDSEQKSKPKIIRNLQ